MDISKIISDKINGLEPELVSALVELCSIPAVNPSDGGTGESARCAYLAEKLKSLGFDNLVTYSCKDESGNERPNLLLRFPGKSSRRIWIVSHTDIVPAGNLSDWQSDPYKPEVRDGKIYGRGTNDNGTSLIASIYALYALKELGIAPEYEVNLAFVANEEQGSTYGIRFLIAEKLFSPDDIVIVPDSPNPDGSFIEIAEKTILQYEFTIAGKAGHAASPQFAENACRAANEFSFFLDEALHKAFPQTDERFIEPSCSTFEPTRRAANVNGINVIPGSETLCFDCRVLPSVTAKDVEKTIDAEIAKLRARHNVTVTYRRLGDAKATPVTSQCAAAVSLLANSAEEMLNVKTEVGGIGGGTCGAYFRAAGIPAAVWGVGDEVAHMANEYANISDLTKSAKVFARMLCSTLE